MLQELICVGKLLVVILDRYFIFVHLNPNRLYYMFCFLHWNCNLFLFTYWLLLILFNDVQWITINFLLFWLVLFLIKNVILFLYTLMFESLIENQCLLSHSLFICHNWRNLILLTLTISQKLAVHNIIPTAHFTILCFQNIILFYYLYWIIEGYLLVGYNVKISGYKHLSHFIFLLIELYYLL